MNCEKCGEPMSLIDGHSCKKIDIQFSTTVYVQATTPQMDMVVDRLNHWANGNENNRIHMHL